MAPQTIRLHKEDNVVVARTRLAPGTVIAAERVTCRDRIPVGHKVASRPIAVDAPVRKYGQIIGFATRPIAAGAHVHVHNVAIRDLARDYEFGTETRAPEPVPETARATFDGFLRADGRVGTRNYIGVLSTVNCSGSVARFIAEAFRGDALADYPEVDGVVVLNHGIGCGLAPVGDADDKIMRTFAGYARHPNFAGVLIVGLGCERLQVRLLLERAGLEPGAMLRTMTIQDTGGTRATVDRAVAWIREMLPEAARARRTPQSADRLVVGLECGGSDAYSGITANPALGAAADRLVAHGGTAVLAETPEIYGAEHLLTRRAVDREVGEKLVAHIKWWEDYAARHGADMNNNPSPGNKEGGLTTIYEKSLGAAAKGGTTSLVDVYHYAEPITAKGFVFMDTPGYDPVSVTGMVAGGVNLVCFTTGRGSVFGCKPVPSLKLATNSAVYERMRDDMDIDCGPILDDGVSVGEMGERIFRAILETASGRRTRSEELGMGDDEFLPWQIGAVL